MGCADGIYASPGGRYPRTEIRTPFICLLGVHISRLVLEDTVDAQVRSKILPTLATMYICI